VPWERLRDRVADAGRPVDGRVYPISGSLLLNFMGQGVMMPVLPLLARDAGLEAQGLGLVAGASALGRLLTNVPAASLANRLGRRPLLVAGPLLSCAGMAGFAACPASLPLFAGCNALAGVGGALTSAGAGLYLADISTPQNRSQTMAPLMTTALLGFAMGPALGGFVAEAHGLRAPFLLTSAGMFASSLAAAAFLPETMRRGEGGGREEGAGEQWAALGKMPAMQAINSVTFMTGVAQGASPVTSILFATETLMMSPAELGVMFTA
jgi:MFS family permease